MSYEKLKEFILQLNERGFSINEIQKAIITNHNMVLCLEDVQGLLEDAKSVQTVQKHARAREEKVLSALCEKEEDLEDTQDQAQD